VASVCRAKGQLGVKAVPIGGPPWHERRNRSLSQSRVLFEVPCRYSRRNRWFFAGHLLSAGYQSETT
jgi:hypothetical protein